MSEMDEWLDNFLDQLPGIDRVAVYLEAMKFLDPRPAKEGTTS